MNRNLLPGVLAGALMVLPGASLAQSTTIWSGVYSKEQGARGEEVHSSVCGKCHGPRLNGAGWPDQPPSPAIAREGFLMRWEDKSLAELYGYIREGMPADNPGILTEQQAVDAIAHMLAISNVPAGDKELKPDEGALGAIVIKKAP